MDSTGSAHVQGILSGSRSDNVLEIRCSVNWPCAQAAPGRSLGAQGYSYRKSICNEFHTLCIILSQVATDNAARLGEQAKGFCHIKGKGWSPP